MSKTIKIHNRIEAMREVFDQEFIYTLATTGDVETVTTNPNLYFQKLWIYPGKAVVTGIITANTNAIYAGKSGNVAVVNPTEIAVGDGNTLALVTAPGHGLFEGMMVVIAGMTPGGYNGTYQISNVNANTFTYQPTALPAGPATVVGTITRVQYCPDILNPTDFPIKYELPLGQKNRLIDVIVTGTAGDGVFLRYS